MITENVHPNDRLVKFRICALRDVVVQMFLVSQSIHTLEYELEEGLQVLGAGTRDKNVRVTVSECSSDSKPQSSRFPSSSCSGQSNGRRKRLLGDGIDECEDSLCLIESLGELDELSDRFRVKQGFFQTSELRLFFCLSEFVFQGFDVLSA